jgi:uncharacterized Zn-finger protein
MRSLHSTIKPFECGICDKKFSRMDALKRHVGRPGATCYQPHFLDPTEEEDEGEPGEGEAVQGAGQGVGDFDEFQIY